MAALIAVTLWRFWVASHLPLSADEAYYWVWSRALQPGYFDHPPMVALFIRAGTALAGDGALGIRLLSPVSAALGTLFLADAAAILFPAVRNVGVTAAVLLNGTLMVGAGAVTMTPDTPLLLFWTIALWTLARAAADQRWLLAFGAAAGLALLSKYTAVLLAPVAGLWLLRTRGWAVLRSPYVWGGAIIAASLFAPVVAWNAAHDWVSFAKQGARASSVTWANATKYETELVLGQVGLATPLLFAMFAAGFWAALRRAVDARDGAAALLTLLIVVPMAVFARHALGARVQANWPGIAYPAAAIAAAAFPVWRPLPSAALGLLLGVLVAVQATTAAFPVPPKLDPTLRQLGGWPELAEAVGVAARGTDFIVADEYGVAASLARLVPPGMPVVAEDSRWATFDLPTPDIAGQTGLLVVSTRRDPAGDTVGWDAAEPAGTAERARDGVVAERFRLYRVSAPARGLVTALMPRPQPRPQP